MRILREDTVALLIDIQDKLVPVIDGSDQIIRNSVKLTEGLRILDVPVIALRQYPKGLGDLVPPIREALGGARPVDKTAFSAWGCPEAADRIREQGRKTVVVYGVEAHVCVLQTVVDLLEHGYRVALAADCVGSRAAADREIALRRAEREGALLVTCESILFELLREAGSDAFKRISKLVK